VLRALGLQNTLTGLIVIYCAFTLPFTVWIMKAYFETVPDELDKSALVDGCSRFQAYYRVVLPSPDRDWWPPVRSPLCSAGTSSSSPRC